MLNIDWLDISSTMALISMGCLTANICLGLLIRYKKRTIRKISILKVHKLTGYAAAIFILAHIILIPLAKDSGFSWWSLLLPLWTKHQVLANCLGAITFYLLSVVVVTSYYQKKIQYSLWRKLHYLSYIAVFPLFVHGIITDPQLKDKPIDWMDGEKVFIELLAAGTIILLVFRFILKPQRKPEINIKMD